MLATLRDSLTRLWTWASPAPRELSTSSFGRAQASQAMPPRLSMRALIRHPYVWACVNRIADDLSGLPLIAVAIDGQGQEREVPLPRELVQAPNSAQTHREWRAQLYADDLLTGNAYVWRVGESAYRLHPAKVQIEYNALGLPTTYVFDGSTRIPLREVGHVRGLSWSDDAQELFGESAIRPLFDELQAAAAAKALAAESSRRGRAEWLLTLKDPMGGASPDLGARIRQEWEAQLRDGKGALFVGEALEATQLSTSLRDLEYQTLQERADFAILAVFGVPPSVIGIPAANYGTSKQDSRRYWDNLKPRARRFDAMLTHLYGAPGVLEIRHEFGGVEALQVAKTEQLEQAKILTELGARPYDAMRWTGLLNPPMAPDTEPRTTQLTPLSAEEPDEPHGTRTVGDVLGESRDRYARAVRRGEYDLRAVDADALAPLIGEPDARDLAELVYRAVRGHVAACRADGTEPHLAGLWPYSAAFAAAYAARMEVA